MTVLELDGRIAALERKVDTGFQNLADQQAAMLNVLHGRTSHALIGVAPGRLIRVTVALSVALAFFAGGAAGTCVALVALARGVSNA